MERLDWQPCKKCDYHHIRADDNCMNCIYNNAKCEETLADYIQNEDVPFGIV